MEDNSVFFGSNDLSQVVRSYLFNHEFNDLPKRDIKMHKLARNDKSIITSAEYTDKEVTVLFHLKGCDRGDAEEILRNLKALVQQINQPLVVMQANTEITYLEATLQSDSFQWLSNTIVITLNFVCSDPIGYEDEDTTFVNVNVTTSNYSITLNIEGSAVAKPVINLSFSSITSGTAKTVTVSNDSIGLGLSITRNWTSGDIVEIDTGEYTVLINGVSSDFSGNFPTFFPGPQTFGYVDDFSARTLDITSTYKKRYT